MSILHEGDRAPGFTAKDQNGKEVSLSDFKGKTVILYFYPTDNTPTCTTEACNFRDNYQSLVSKGFEVIGISPDTERSHKKFEAKYSLPFTLIADENLAIHHAYGVWQEKTTFGKTYMGTLRTTFIINGDGFISHIIDKVKSKTASQQILDALAS